MEKPVITIRRGGPNDNASAVLGIAHAAMMEAGFRALKTAEDYLKDADLIVMNFVTMGNLMKEKAMLSASYESALQVIGKYVTINWI